MSSEVRIPAEQRTEFGKGFARRSRRAGKVPAVLYGHGEAPRHLALPARELGHAFKGASGSNVLLRLELGSSDELALPRQIQRDPLRGDVTHVDLLLVRMGEKVVVDIPIVIVGDIPAVKIGGMLDQQSTVLHVEAEATHIPSSLEIDGTLLKEVGAVLHARDVKLPAGVTLVGDPDAIVVHIVGAPTEAEFEAELAADTEAVAGEVALEETAAAAATDDEAPAGDAPAEG